jgi:hypothetical protein
VRELVTVDTDRSDARSKHEIFEFGVFVKPVCCHFSLMNKGTTDIFKAFVQNNDPWFEC